MTTNQIPQYAMICGTLLEQPELVNRTMDAHHLKGTEVFMDEVHSRTLPLYSTPEELHSLAEKLTALRVKRLHCSYWAWPTALLTQNRFSFMVEAMGGETAVREYYGDLTGAHLYDRWCQEYALAREINAQAYTFHLIDYAPIDGRWEFKIPVSDIRQAMVYMIQRLLNELGARNLLDESSPRIELENAGYGLEYGMQDAPDAAFILSQLYDPHHKVCLAWEINHLLHATGVDPQTGLGIFMLPDDEKTDAMRRIEACELDAQGLCTAWVLENLLDPRIVQHVGAVHLSDCVAKDIGYFVRGRLIEPWGSELDALPSWEAMEEYGVRIVLDDYDSHVPMGTKGSLDVQRIREALFTLANQNDDFVILHELKNETDILKAVVQQQAVMNLS